MLEGLFRLLPQDRFKRSAEDLQFYGRDWTRLVEPKPSAIVFPQSTQEVQTIVRWARENRVALVPSGGRTGLSGGAVASQGEVVVSLERMNKILEFNAVDQILRVEAGCVTQVAQEEIRSQGFYFPVDFASRGSSQIGGNISTNAGGIKVIRYGHFRDWVAGITVVTGAGEILDLSQNLIKNNAGYELKHLFIAAEGTLGLITEASLRFTTPPAPLGVFLLQARDLKAALEVVLSFRKKVTLTAFEFFTDQALRYVCEAKGVKPPFSDPSPYYFLVEFEDEHEEKFEAALSCFDELKEKGMILDGSMSQNEQQSREMWEYRESISESLARFKPFKNDIAVSISKIPDFVEDAGKLLKSEFPDLETVWFGHIGDGNLHINVLKPDAKSMEAFAKDCDRVAISLFGLIQKYRGSISAEHGIGLLKKPYLHFSRTQAEIEVMKRIKPIFDPAGIMNPGKIF